MTAPCGLLLELALCALAFFAGYGFEAFLEKRRRSKCQERDIVASLMLLAFGLVLVLMPGWSAVTVVGYVLGGLGFWNLLVLKAFEAKGGDRNRQVPMKEARKR